MRPVAIYLILDEAEQPRYVGRTFHIRRRPLDHLRRHPYWAFSYRVLEIVSPDSRWQDRERYWIAYYRRFALLENIARGGGSAGPRSPDAIRRQREKMIGRCHSEDALRKIRETVRRRTPERRAEIGRRISASKKGKIPNWSPEGKQRTIEALKRIGSPMQGKKHSAETRQIIGEKSKGHPPNSGSFQKGIFRPKSESWKRKRSLSQTGKRLSDETKAKLRQLNLGKRHSDETKRKMSEAQIARRRTST